MECDARKRNVLLSFECDGRRYRIVAEITSAQGDVEAYLEQYIMETGSTGLSGKEVWLRVSKELSNANKMTIEQCTQMLSFISSFINENFMLM